MLCTSLPVLNNGVMSAFLQLSQYLLLVQDAWYSRLSAGASSIATSCRSLDGTRSGPVDMSALNPAVVSLDKHEGMISPFLKAAMSMMLFPEIFKLHHNQV